MGLLEKIRSPTLLERFRKYIDKPETKKLLTISLIPLLAGVCDALFWCVELWGAIKALSLWEQFLLAVEVLVICASAIGTGFRSKGFLTFLPLPVMPFLLVVMIAVALLHLSILAMKHKAKHVPQHVLSVASGCPESIVGSHEGAHMNEGV